MSLCMSGQQCSCQPDEDVFCPWSEWIAGMQRDVVHAMRLDRGAPVAYLVTPPGNKTHALYWPGEIDRVKERAGWTHTPLYAPVDSLSDGVSK